MERLIRWVLLVLLAALVGGVAVNLERGSGVANAQQAAGLMTVDNRTSAALEQPAAGLSAAEWQRHKEADVLFDRTHVPLEGRPGAGLGPRFNADSCVACHVRNGRGRPVMGQALVRVALRDGRPVPGIGHQVRDRAVFGAQPDAAVEVSWTDIGVLRRPDIVLESSGSPAQDLSPQTVARSLRIAPPLIGLGLLEAVPEAQILARADPNDRDGDGISGRPHWLEDARGQPLLGRFGWKALTASVRDQSAAALLNDMGLTTPAQPGSELAADGTPADINNQELNLVTYYSQTLGAPRTVEPASSPLVRRGEQLFADLHCARCHVPQLTTRPSPQAVARALNGQTIWPYSDLLLHDLGPGLDDGVAERGAASHEWRTAPLWGLGLTQRVNSSAGYLHDGRARTLEEAILWHGGEAEEARQRFAALPSQGKRELLAWLNQL